MHRTLGWMLLAVLCCAAGDDSPQEQPAARLEEARMAVDEALALEKSGQASDCRRAETLFERALSIQESAPKPDQLEIAQTLEKLADLYSEVDFSDKAESLLLRVLTLREAALGKEHPLFAQTLNDLAGEYQEQGRFSQAESLYLRSLAIREAALGREDRSIAQSLANLSLIYVKQGAYERAESKLQRALAIERKSPGKTPLRIAMMLRNLASVYYLQRMYDKMDPLIDEALDLAKGGSGLKYIDVMFGVLLYRANSYRDQGLYDKAESLYRSVISMVEKAYGMDHAYGAGALSYLAESYLDQGLYSQAEPLFQRAFDFRKAHYGEQNESTITALYNLALLRLAQHRLGDALDFLTHALTLFEQRLRYEALDLSESRLEDLLRSLRTDEQILYSLLRRYPDDPRVQRLALSVVLLLKNRSSQETAHISRALHGDLNAEDLATFERLRNLRTQLASLSLAGPGPLGLEDHQRRRETLITEGDALEAELARRSAPFRHLAAPPSLARIVDQVASSLPKDAALVEFVAYEDRPPVSPPGTPRARIPTEKRYLALVLFPDASIRTVDLGASESLDREISLLRDALTHRDAAFQAKAQQLYRRVFQPLRPSLGSTRRLFLSTDGELSLVPFAALHDGSGFLLDSFDLIYLTSGRDLLSPPQPSAPASFVFVFADPDFESSPRAAPSTPGDDSARATPSSERLKPFLSTQRSVHPPLGDSLPATRQEAESIQHLLPQAQLFLGSEATKERLLHLPIPGILHVATHGFFFKDPSPTAGPGDRSLIEATPAPPRPSPPAGPESLRAVAQNDMPDDLPLADLQEPLLRSGLVLAGTNAPAPDTSAPSRPRLESSLVTALELAGLDLWGTQLVVLSACDTGRGDVRPGQGVYGLRRALAVAGAETVVMSLWKVEDGPTQQLMNAYYTNLLKGKGRATALREAMRWLQDQPPFSHPYYWAPFIAQGSDAPLRGIAPTAPATPRAP